MLDEQAAAGKEMMKLMGDLIAHLRDLLVFKVRPDALADEAAPEIQSSLGEEAALVETDRLLELIEQFAGAEGRMKWAPNKKLHFEVAVIKAIQTLSQVTLSEVIENLTALRGGGGSSSSAPAAPARSLPKAAEPAKKTAVAPPKPSPPLTPAPAAQSKPAAIAPTAPQPPAATSSVEMTAVWPKVVQLAYTRRPLIKTWIALAHLLGTEGRNVMLGFAPGDKTVMESLARPANRSFLEELLKELTGSDWTVKLSIVEGMPAVPQEVAPASRGEKIRADRIARHFQRRPADQGSPRDFQRRNQIRHHLT